MYYSIVLSREAVMVMVTIVGTGLGLRCFTSMRRWMGRWRRMGGGGVGLIWVGRGFVRRGGRWMGRWGGGGVMVILRHFRRVRRRMGRWGGRGVVEVIRHFTSMRRRIDRWRRRWVVGVIMVI